MHITIQIDNIRNKKKQYLIEINALEEQVLYAQNALSLNIKSLDCEIKTYKNMCDSYKKSNITYEKLIEMREKVHKSKSEVVKLKIKYSNINIKLLKEKGIFNKIFTSLYY